VAKPVRVYANIPIGQISFHVLEGSVSQPYNKKKNAKYSGQEAKPKESMM
jgi:dCTP deaminase